MDVEARRDREALLEFFERHRIHLKQFQVLEVLFRSAHMTNGKLPIQYITFSTEINLNTLQPKERIHKCMEIIENWQIKNPKLIFGCEGYHINELKTAKKLLRELKAAEKTISKLQTLDGIGVELGSNWTKQAISSYIHKLETEVGLGELRTKKDASVIKEFDPSKYEYFRNYIGFATGIFRKFYEHLSIPDGEISKFLALKLRREHAEIPQLQDINGERLNDRIRKSYKTYEPIIEMPTKLGLVSGSFFETLECFKFRDS